MSSEHRTQLGASGSVRPVTCTFCRPLCVLVWCAPDASGDNLGASGAVQVTVRLSHESFKRRHVADVGAPDVGAERPVPL